MPNNIGNAGSCSDSNIQYISHYKKYKHLKCVKMFEDDCDVDFGADFTVNFENHKRPAGVEPRTAAKKAKVIAPVKKKVVERKFPGPAGILPDNKDRSFDWIQLENPENIDNNKNEEILCSQMSVGVFQTSPWLEVVRDFQALIEKYDIKWIKRNADLDKLPNQKAPFLAAVIKHIECLESNNPIVKVCLKDQTGEIYGTVIYSLYKKYAKDLILGSVIVLRQCGVLNTSYSNNNYVIITLDNLVAIYSRNKGVVKVREVSYEDLLKTDLVGDSGCSRISVKTTKEEEKIWQNALEGVDVDLLFEDDF